MCLTNVGRQSGGKDRESEKNNEGGWDPTDVFASMPQKKKQQDENKLTLLKYDVLALRARASVHGLVGAGLVSSKRSSGHSFRFSFSLVTTRGLFVRRASS